MICIEKLVCFIAMHSIVGVHCRKYVCFSPKYRSVNWNIQALKKGVIPCKNFIIFFLYDFLLFVGETKLQRSLISNTYELSPTEVADFNTYTQKTGNCLFLLRNASTMCALWCFRSVTVSGEYKNRSLNYLEIRKTC